VATGKLGQGLQFIGRVPGQDNIGNRVHVPSPAWARFFCPAFFCRRAFPAERWKAERCKTGEGGARLTPQLHVQNHHPLAREQEEIGFA